MGPPCSNLMVAWGEVRPSPTQLSFYREGEGVWGRRPTFLWAGGGRGPLSRLLGQRSEGLR